jgi:transposase-like protein
LARELKSGPLAAQQLGIPESNIHNWRSLEKDGVLPSAVLRTGPQPTLEEENRRLQRELTEQKKVNHILKLAAAFFSQDHLK